MDQQTVSELVQSIDVDVHGGHGVRPVDRIRGARGRDGRIPRHEHTAHRSAKGVPPRLPPSRFRVAGVAGHPRHTHPGASDTQGERRPQPESDREIFQIRVQRVLAGDQTAFSEIYDAYAPRVHGYIMKRVGDFPEAEDLTQETFVQLYRSLDSFEGRSSLLTWTFGIAHNVCSRYFRHCSRWMVGPKNARELDDHPSDAAIERRLDAAHVLERCDVVLEAGRRPAHREIFRLRYAESQSIRTIAKQVGKSSEAVKVSLRRSRNLLMDGVPELALVLDTVAHGA
jgi:RNA polymerase sigma factor (sigma-70 family)